MLQGPTPTPNGSALPPLCRLAATSLPAGESLALGGHRPASTVRFPYVMRVDVGIDPYNKTERAP